MKRISKLRITWVAITIGATVLGYLMLMHGGTYGEFAERNNRPSAIYQLEVYAGQLLTWPITVYGWLNSRFGNSNMLGREAWVFQILGYVLLYKLHSKLISKNT